MSLFGLKTTFTATLLGRAPPACAPGSRRARPAGVRADSAGVNGSPGRAKVMGPCHAVGIFGRVPPLSASIEASPGARIRACGGPDVRTGAAAVVQGIEKPALANVARGRKDELVQHPACYRMDMDAQDVDLSTGQARVAAFGAARFLAQASAGAVSAVLRAGSIHGDVKAGFGSLQRRI